MPRELSQEQRLAQTEHEDLATLSYEDLLATVELDAAIAPWRPEGCCRVDPRTGERTVYAPSRGARPHDNRPETALRDAAPPERPCPVCLGKTTSIIDVAPLSRGHTFINKNLYPILYPGGPGPWLEPGRGAGPAVLGEPAAGLHLLQWSSTLHDDDLPTMPLADVRVVLDRLALLEERLLHGGEGRMPSTAPYEDEPHFGYVGVIKNFGHLVGGSLTHGHQQIVHVNAMPRKVLDDVRFRAARGEAFATFLARENPADLDVRRWGPVRAVVPYFMKRPLDSVVLIEGARTGYLHHLGDEARDGLAAALHDLLGAVLAAMPRIGRQPTFNLVVHNGPVGELYVELHPYTQEMGGYEHLGLFVCQSTPRLSRDLLVEAMGGAR